MSAYRSCACCTMDLASPNMLLVPCSPIWSRPGISASRAAKGFTSIRRAAMNWWSAPGLISTHQFEISGQRIDGVAGRVDHIPTDGPRYILVHRSEGGDITPECIVGRGSDAIIPRIQVEVGRGIGSCSCQPGEIECHIGIRHGLESSTIIIQIVVRCLTIGSPIEGTCDKLIDTNTPT